MTAYTRRGSGEPVVLVHGIGHRGQAFTPVMDLLAEQYDVIAVDLAGHGLTPPPAEGGSGYRITRHADRLEELFAELGLDRPHVVGNSLGGHIAMELAHRGAVRSCTALSPAGFATLLGNLWALVVLLLLKAGAHLPETQLRRTFATPRGRRLSHAALYVHGDRFSAEELLEDARNLRRSKGLWGQLLHDGRFRHERGRTYGVPVTVAWGDRDALLLPTQARRAKRMVPAAVHVRLRGCGHVPMVDDPQAVVAVITETAARARLAPAA